MSAEVDLISASLSCPVQIVNGNAISFCGMRLPRNHFVDAKDYQPACRAFFGLQTWLLCLRMSR